MRESRYPVLLGVALMAQLASPAVADPVVAATAARCAHAAAGLPGQVTGDLPHGSGRCIRASVCPTANG